MKFRKSLQSDIRLLKFLIEMKERNDGIAFEEITKRIFERLVRNPNYEKVRHNVVLDGKYGKRQIDVLLENKIFGLDFLTIIECKDHNRKLSIKYIDEFSSKLNDVNANKGILVSRKGFSTQAIKKAKDYGITLCTINDFESADWLPRIDYPIIFEELKPIDLSISSNLVALENAELDSFYFPRWTDKLRNYVTLNWANNNFSINKKTGYQEIHLNNIEPFMFETKQGVKCRVDNPIFRFKLRINYFKANLNDLSNQELLSNITEGKNTFFVELPSIKDINEKFERVSKPQYENFKGFVFTVKVFPELEIDTNSLDFKIVKGD